MKHLAYGLVIEADLALPVPTVDRDPRIAVTRTVGPPDETSVSWLSDDEESGWRTGRRGQGGTDHFVLGYVDLAVFTVSADGDRIGWWAPDIDRPTLEHLILDHVIPVAMARLGLAVLHASVLVRPDGWAVAVAGRSGWGKSTLASALAENGFELMADDCAAITLPAGDVVPAEIAPAGGARPTVAAAYPGVRLHDHSLDLLADGRRAEVTGEVSRHSEKLRLNLADSERWDGDRSAPLGAVFLLDPPEADHGDREPVRLSPAQALFTLFDHSFHLGAGSERTITLDRLGALVDAVPIVQLAYRRDRDGLAAVVEQISTLAGSLAPGSG